MISTAVSLIDIISGVRERGLDMPVLLRFENLLDSQISYLNNSFREAMSKLGLQGRIPWCLSNKGQPAAAGRRRSD